MQSKLSLASGMGLANYFTSNYTGVSDSFKYRTRLTLVDAISKSTSKNDVLLDQPSLLWFFSSSIPLALFFSRFSSLTLVLGTRMEGYRS